MSTLTIISIILLAITSYILIGLIVATIYNYNLHNEAKEEITIGNIFQPAIFGRYKGCAFDEEDSLMVAGFPIVLLYLLWIFIFSTTPKYLWSLCSSDKRDSLKSSYYKITSFQLTHRKK